ncbi:MAG: hypothetical protein LC725_05940, partial [Lentisphaerae bacterium]|nr:hypothetical protein [Lentisphaerota bacterium]
DMLALIYSGHATAAPQPAAAPDPAALTPEPAARAPEPAAITGRAPAATSVETEQSPTPDDPPATMTAQLFRKSVTVQVADDLTMRLPIPNP